MQQFSKDKNIPIRSFTADETKNASGLNGPKAIADDIDTIIKMFDPDAKIPIQDETGEPGQAPGGIDERNLKPALRQKIQDAYDYTKNYYDFSLVFKDNTVTEFLESFDSLYQSYVVENKQLRCNAYCENTLSCAVSAMSCAEYVEQNDGGGELVSFTFDFDFPDGRTYKLIVSNPNTAKQEVVFTNTTLPDWTMQPNKPSYTADEVGSYSKTKIDMDFKGIYTVMGGNTQAIGGMKSDIEGLQQRIREEAHFRGYLSTNAEIQTMDATPNDFAYSAESGTVWVYTDKVGWQNTMNPVPDQLTPASTTTPLMNGTASKGQEEAYARGDHRHPHDVTKVDKAEFESKIGDIEETLENHRQDLSKKMEETIFYEDVVNTPVWTNQPTIEGTLDAAFNTTDFYYVTLKDASGNALPSGRFMLKDSYANDATVYSTVFLLENLNTGTATLVENYPVEFISIGTDYALRDAGITSYVQNTDGLDISSGFGSIRMVLQGEVIPRNTNLYVYPQYKTDKNVVSYHSTNATSALQGDSTKDIVAYTNLPELNNVGNLLYDSTVLKKGGSGYFSLERNVVIRYNEDYKNAKAYQVFGFGKILSENTNIASIAFRLNNVNNGMLRNGTKIIISEVR